MTTQSAHVLSDEELFAQADYATFVADIATAAAPALATPEDDLADLLHELGERAPVFTVHDEGSAGWAMDKILTLGEKIARVKAQADDIIAALNKDKARLERRFMPELEAWYLAQPKKGKTIKLLQGTLSARTVPGKPAALGVTDPRAALDWAKEQFPGAVIAVLTLEAKTLIDHVHETGECVPGVEMLPGRPDYESFSIKGAKA